MSLKISWSYGFFASTIGLILIQLATPLALAIYWYFANEILIEFMRLAIKPYLDILVSLPLAIGFALLGFCLWFPRWQSPRAISSSSKLIPRSRPKQPSTTYYIWMLSLTVFSVPANVLALGWVLLVWIVTIYISDFPPDIEKQQVFFVFLFGYLLLLVAQFMLSFLIGRYHWRLLQSTRIKNVAEA